MKILSIVLVVTSLSAYGQTIWDALEKNQGSVPDNSSTGSGSGSSVTPAGKTAKNEWNTKCEMEVNESLPLKHIESLFQVKPTTLQVDHDSRSGNLTLSTGGMIDNCSSMIDWEMAPKTINDYKVYAIQLKFEKNGSCAEDAVSKKTMCEFRVAKIVDGLTVYETVKFEPNIVGFQECLKKTGVISATGTINASAILKKKGIASFSGVNEKGDVVIESVGGQLNSVGAKYGDFVFQNGCSRFENVASSAVTVYSAAEESRIEKDKRAAELLSCKDYNEVADFIEKNVEYRDMLLKILEPLIDSAMKKSTAAILKGKGNDEDLEVVAMFDRHIARPKIDKARLLYEEVKNASVDSVRKEKQAELTKVLADIVKYQKVPYISAELIVKLEGKGLFEDAQRLNGLKATLSAHTKLGVGSGDNKVTPESADEVAEELIQKYADALQDKKDRYLAQTGQSETSRADEYNDMANNLRDDMQSRSENFNYSMGIEAACISHPQDQSSQQRCYGTYGVTCDKYCKQNGGRYCYGAFVFNKQRCIEDGQYALQDLAADLQHFNTVDTERVSEYDKKSDEWYQLEQKGRRYVAAQNGERYTERDTRERWSGDQNQNQNQNQNQQYANSPYGAFGAQQQYQQNSMVPGYNQNMFQQQQNPFGQYVQGGNNYGSFGGQNSNQYGGQANGYNGNMYGAFGNGQQQYGGNQYNQYGGSAFGFNAGAQFGAPQYGQQYGQQQYGQQYGQQPYGQQYGQQQYGQYGNGAGQYGAFGGAQGANNMGYWNNPAQAYGNYNMNGGNYGAFGQ